MIDLHTHSLFSDGVLLPSELVYRAKVHGYTAIALTDHGDLSTFDFVIPRLKKVAKELSRYYAIRVLPGIELTYVPPKRIKDAVGRCRRLGAEIVVVHGETPAETVPPGTNCAGILSGADILAHPGYITDEEVRLAREYNVLLEITTRSGHNAANRHVAEKAQELGASLIIDTDTHAPENLMTEDLAAQTLKKSGLPQNYFATLQKNAANLIKTKHR